MKGRVLSCGSTGRGHPRYVCSKANFVGSTVCTIFPKYIHCGTLTSDPSLAHTDCPQSEQCMLNTRGQDATKNNNSHGGFPLRR